MKKTINPIIRTTTEFIILPPCGDRNTYEISMNSPHPILFFDALSPPLKSPQPPFSKGGGKGRLMALLYSDGFLCQMENSGTRKPRLSR